MYAARKYDIAEVVLSGSIHFESVPNGVKLIESCSKFYSSPKPLKISKRLPKTRLAQNFNFTLQFELIHRLGASLNLLFEFL